EDISQIREFIALNPGLVGFNVTIPHKKTIIPFLDELSPEAIAIGAVNTVKIQHKNASLYLTGYNTDCVGFANSLKEFIRDLTGVKALVLGTGGSSNAVVYALEQLGTEYKKVSREKKPGCLVYDEITPDIIAENKLIINTTPLGMHPNIEGVPPIPYNALTPRHSLYDLVYNPENTVFLQKGKEQGAQTMNGLKMLYGQAEEAFRKFI
ncbi:MAG TPA: shikimate dehydrogenase, partial [Bacteroidia bacterium]|nr:shikimate dehydrogenase [Bacteroidia bacterium]